MALKDKLPVSYLLFTTRGRIDRLTYWTVSIFISASFYILFNALLYGINYAAAWVLYPLLAWALLSTAIKRLHDTNKSAHWLWLLLVPALGPLLLILLLAFKKGSAVTNRFGAVPGSAPDYFKNGQGRPVQTGKTSGIIIDEVTQLYPVSVAKVERPGSVDALQKIIKDTTGRICVGGGRFSMGGQTASGNGVHIDMRQMNKVLAFSPGQKTIKVQAGIRWCDIQQYIDPYNLSVKIMQTYANFTVGGSLSVNCHGRYIGLGAVILSVKSLEVILANGELAECSSIKNVEIFFACVGCYNAIAVIATVEFELTENVPVKRIFKTMPASAYRNFFAEKIKEKEAIIFHNADLYPPAFKNVRAVSWVKTDEKPTVKTRLMPLADAYPLERYFINAFSRSNFGKWRREYIVDPILYLSKKVHWRNYEAGYDVAELEPESRLHSTYVLQEYFIPVNSFDAFNCSMAEIFKRYKVNVINVSVRHAEKDPGSMLAWATEEVFAFVVWYKQFTNEVEKNKVAVWTRELIDVAIAMNGSYYLPYQAHAAAIQFHQAYPGAKKLMDLKDKLDPGFRFSNVIWNTYYKQNKP